MTDFSGQYQPELAPSTNSARFLGRVAAESFVLGIIPVLALLSLDRFNRLMTPMGEVPMVDERWVYVTLSLSLWLFLLLIYPWDYRRYRSNAKGGEQLILLVVIRVLLVGFFWFLYGVGCPTLYLPQGRFDTNWKLIESGQPIISEADAGAQDKVGAPESQLNRVP